jgi:hypothetical protein
MSNWIYNNIEIRGDAQHLALFLAQGDPTIAGRLLTDGDEKLTFERLLEVEGVTRIAHHQTMIPYSSGLFPAWYVSRWGLYIKVDEGFEWHDNCITMYYETPNTPLYQPLIDLAVEYPALTFCNNASEGTNDLHYEFEFKVGQPDRADYFHGDSRDDDTDEDFHWSGIIKTRLRWDSDGVVTTFTDRAKEYKYWRDRMFAASGKRYTPTDPNANL